MINYGKLLDVTKYILNFIVFLFVINICMILGIILGLGIFGLAPTLFAGFIVVSKWLNNSREYYFTQFWKSYKNNFIKSNVIALISYCMIFIIQNYSITLYNYILNGTSYFFLVILLSIFIIISILLLSFIIYAPLINSLYNMKIKDLITLSLSMFIYAPLNTVRILIVLLFCFYIISVTPIASIIIFPLLLISIISVSQKLLQKIRMQVIIIE